MEKIERMSIQTQIDVCLLKKEYIDKSTCLNDLQINYDHQMVNVVGGAVILSICLVGILLCIHHKTRNKK